jgi:hypothetical protein
MCEGGSPVGSSHTGAELSRVGVGNPGARCLLEMFLSVMWPWGGHGGHRDQARSRPRLWRGCTEAPWEPWSIAHIAAH